MRERPRNPRLDGLTEAEAQQSRQKYGANELTRKKRRGFLQQFIESFGDPIIKILLMALGINIIFTIRNFNWYETVGIATAVLIATLVSTLSEYGSESAFEKLQAEASQTKSRVKRDDRVREIPAAEIVVGDLVMIAAGERIPADGKLIYGGLSVDQSALNGETKEARKQPVASAEFADENKLFRGSIVCQGEGVMVVESVGDNTVYGRLASEIQEETIDSPLKTRLADLAATISRFGYAAAAVVVAANLFNNIVLANNFSFAQMARYFSGRASVLSDLIHAITLGITVIVMAVPEGLPMMITVVLSANMKRMLRENVLVRKLVGIETSGSLNILFTDKTGTLTAGRLAAAAFIDARGTLLEVGELKSKPLYKRVRLGCLFNNSAVISAEGGKTIALGGNSTDRALLELVMDDVEDGNVYEKGAVYPFNSNDKLSITEIFGGRHTWLVKGAPEKLLPCCTHAYDLEGKKRALTDASSRRAGGAAERTLKDAAEKGMRLLALCESELPQEPQSLAGLALVGFIGINDGLRKEARGAISEITGAGVQIVMITGDNRETAVSVAEDAGLLNGRAAGAVLTSAELETLTDGELKERLRGLRVIARALPADKSRLVRVAQESGLVAGMTGDGVNDAPALKRADVGFAMGDGAEIAKEAGDIVILDNNIASISKAILYGRTIFKSIRKFIIFQLTVNLCAVMVSVIGPFIGVESPVTVIQMLWVNIIMDTLAGLAYAGETPLPEYMREAPKGRDEKIINRYMYNQIVFTGLYTTLLCLLFLKIPLVRGFFGGRDEYLMTGFFALFIFAGIFNSFNARTHRLNLFSHMFKNKWFIAIMAMVAGVQIALIYYGGLIFRTTGLKAAQLMAVLAAAGSVVCVDLARKLLLRANKRKGFL
ncbi:MAG: calcium-translocating P-type ATPase, PMCA-type [Clostridiales bacterium]|jgi:calcium-translocating P-type ATPase|nr:calcium-translocating P-type ATPase, PMCA-type [Clostridiales bacterium]